MVRPDATTTAWRSATRSPTPAPGSPGGPTEPAVADALLRARHLGRHGHPAQALELVERIAATAGDPGAVAQALVMRLDGLLSLNRTAECAAAIDRAFAAVHAHPNPCTLGEFHALAAVVAHLDGSLERCVTHLVRAGRALAMVDTPSRHAADAWYALAITASQISFHSHAMSAIERAREVAAAADVPDHDYVAPQIRVRLAVTLDHRGDTDGCVRVLRDVIAELDRRRAQPDGVALLRPCARAFFGYALARLRALGVATVTDPMDLLADPGETTIRDLRVLGGICQSVADGRSDDALATLDSTRVSAKTLAIAEIPRLRALAHLAAGDPVAASEADRNAFRLTATSVDRLRDLFVDGVAARLDHEDLRRTVARFAGEALTDPLTGLPNRRHLEQYVATLTRDQQAPSGGRRAGHAVIGVADLDGFKAVNTIHGHLTGDLVLQRVAGLLARAVRRGDFIARYGGDEFLVVLPDTTLTAAHDIGNRITTTINNEDWQALVPGTPITISIGWAPLDHHTNLTTAFQQADHAMLDAKTRQAAS